MRLTNARRSALAFALALATTLPARAEPPVPQITVTGEGRVDRAPDLATISLGVTTQGDTAAAAMAANSEGVAAVLANLAAAGIEPRDIQTSGLSLNPNWTGYGSSATPQIDGYTAMNSVTVRVRALDGLGTVLDAAVQDGANTLNGLTFGLADPDPAMDEARIKAVADAQRRAGLLAGAAGVTLGPVLTISESFGTGAPAPMYRMDAAASAPVPVASGEVSLVASVTITWALAAE
jgi:uncharacterized protein YggE